MFRDVVNVKVVHLVRHGQAEINDISETYLSKQGISPTMEVDVLQGKHGKFLQEQLIAQVYHPSAVDSPLSARGLQQAKWLQHSIGPLLKKIEQQQPGGTAGGVAVVCSPLGRCLHTAAYLAQYKSDISAIAPSGLEPLLKLSHPLHAGGGDFIDDGSVAREGSSGGSGIGSGSRVTVVVNDMFREVVTGLPSDRHLPKRRMIESVASHHCRHGAGIAGGGGGGGMEVEFDFSMLGEEDRFPEHARCGAVVDERMN